MVDHQVRVDYVAADVWKQRALAAAKADRLARQAVKVALSAVKARGTLATQLAERARIAHEAALQASREAEQIWANTAAVLGESEQHPTDGGN